MRQSRANPELTPWPPDVVLWNFGLHLLHVYPARPVPTVSLQCALSYDRLVASSFRELRSHVPQSTRLIWRTTNAVCDSSFSGSWVAAARAYHCKDSACATSRVLRTRKLCQRRYNVTQGQCEGTFMDRSNTAAQRDMSLSTLRSSPGVEILDAFALTDGLCSATVDGRHYPTLLARINGRLLRMMLARPSRRMATSV